MPAIQYLTDESGTCTAVLVPIELWQKLANGAKTQRRRKASKPLSKPLKSLPFDAALAETLIEHHELLRRLAR